MHSFDDEIVFISIATFLSPKDLLSCRRVCTAWKKLIDHIICDLDLWRLNCLKEYSEIYSPALIKSQLCCYHLYKTFTLWPKISYAQETKMEFAIADHFHEEILGIQVLRDGIVGVHTREKIKYYDVHTLQPAQRDDFYGVYSKYKENDYIISCLNYNKKLTIVFKATWNSTLGHMCKLNNVQMCLAVEKIVYYLTDDNVLYAFEVIGGKFIFTKLSSSLGGVLAFGNRNGYLYILTHYLHVIKVDGNQLKYIQIEKGIALLSELRKYNFLEQLDLKMYYHLLASLKKYTLNISVDEIVTMRSYGRVLFFSYEWGILNVYNSPYNENIIDVIRKKPMKIFNLLDSQKMSLCPILNVEVIEDIDSHKVVVAMPHKVIVINLNHDLWEVCNISQYCDDVVRDTSLNN